VSDLVLIALPVLAGLAAVYLLLPRPRPDPRLWGAAAAALSLLLTLFLILPRAGGAVESILFYSFAGIAVVSGGLLVTQHNPVRAALSFALVVLSTCGLFLLQAAPFLMAATIIVYAGAIIVTFLFVMMLARQVGQSDADDRSREPLLSTVAGFVLLGTILFVLHQSYLSGPSAAGAPFLEARDFEPLLERMKLAADKPTVKEISEALEDAEFFTELRRKVEAGRPTTATRSLAAQVREVEEGWRRVWQPDGRAADMRAALGRLHAEARQVLAEHGRAGMPAENVAHLGKVLFSDYLLGVELAGTLLLVAAIGAIAIAGRRAEGP
jgi:NADH:ubiquinone oxidoreductase subunit 6 (subunit J)